MADKSIDQLNAAENILATDLFVLQQSGTAKKLPGQVLLNWLTAAADGHGGIHSIEKLSTSGLVDTYRITLADTTTFDFAVTNGRSITGISKTSTSGLVDTYTIRYNDNTSGTFTVTNGEKGEKGDNQYIWIKYASQKPTASSHSFGDVADNWIGIYSGDSATAPTDWMQYAWFEIKGAKGDTGSPATLTSSAVEYQVSDSGTIIPSGAWSSAVPVVAQGKYLWTKTEVRFNTGDPIVSYSVARMGVDGTGSVSSVCGVSPGSDGNVVLTAANVDAMPTTGGDFTGAVKMNGQPISGLNDPTEDTQAARKGYVDTAVRKAAPRNLLDNSDFRNPVNHRGLESYIDDGYAIDRWYVWIESGSGSVDVHDGYISVTFQNHGSFYQRIEKGILNPSKMYTIAFKTTDGVIGITYPAYIGYGDNYDLVTLLDMRNGEVQNVEWAALYEGEYTAETIPEYQLKGYGAELAECQRYLQRFRTQNLRGTYCEDFRPTMRMTDTGVVSTFEIEIDGTTYYFASTEL